MMMVMMFKVLDCRAPWWVARLTGEEFQLAEGVPLPSLSSKLHSSLQPLCCEVLRNNFKLAQYL